MVAFCIIFDLFIAYRYPICDVFHCFCKIARFFATEPLEVLKTNLGNNTIVGDNIKFEAKFLNHHFGIALLDAYIRPSIIATIAGDPTYFL